MNLFYFTKQASARLFAAMALFSLVAGLLPTQAFATPADTISYCHVPSADSDKVQLHENQSAGSWNGHDGKNGHELDFLILNADDLQRCKDLIDPPTYQCNDGVDNADTEDTLVDMEDPGCSSPTDDDESNVVTPPVTECNDGVDNADTEDTLVDMADPGCTSPLDTSESNASITECNDGMDNDGDEAIDEADPGCDSPEDNDETDDVLPPACSDDLDNDGDELTDYPADLGCSSEQDDDETNDPDPETCENPNAQNYGEEGACVVYRSQCISETPNLLINGSFEDPGLLNDNSWSNLDNVTGWTYDLLAGLEVWRGLSGFLASNGLHNIELDGDAPTAISQTVATIPGATYELSFDFAARSGTPEANNAVLATADTSTVVNTSTDNTNWVKYGATFQADASTDIVLSDIGSPADTYGTLIDNAVLCLVREPAPVDYCPNIPENQTANDGYLKDVNGQCYTPINSCSVNVVSDTSNTVNDSGALLVTPNGAWVASIAGSIAQWIWGASTDLPISGVVDEVQTFEKSFVWSGTPSTATLKISSDNGYSVKLNGTVVASDAGEFNYQSVDTVIDLTDDIIQGVNTLEISVTNIANGQTSWAANPAALMYDLTITDVTGDCAPDEDGDNNEEDELSCEITASDISIRRGGDVTLTWTSVDAVLAELGDEDVDVNGSTEIENLRSDTTYTLTVYGDYIGESEERESATCSVFINTRSGGGGGNNNDDDDDEEGRVLGDSDSATPEPLVLGEQVSVVPTGAPDTGKGGAAGSIVLGQLLAAPRRIRVS